MEFSSNNFKSDQNSQKKQYVFKYDIFYFSVSDNKKINALNIFFAIRAINILKYKYPEAYTKLIQETLYFPYKEYLNSLINKKIASVNYLNCNKYFFISFNSISLGVASGITYFGDKTTSWIKDASVSFSENFPVISIHEQKLLGSNANEGCKPIYKSETPYVNYQLYMRDGLIETLTHELIHRYIDVNYSVELFCNYLYNNRSSNDKSKNSLEEAIVRYTAVNYFNQSKGISTEMMYFENVQADLNCVDLKNSNQIVPFLNTVNEKKGTHETDIFKVFQIPIW